MSKELEQAVRIIAERLTGEVPSSETVENLAQVPPETTQVGLTDAETFKLGVIATRLENEQQF